MNVSLTKEFEQYISEKVESGLYQSASEVVRDGLRLLKERDELHQSRLAELRKTIDVGIEQADRGQTQPFDEATVAWVKARGRELRDAANKSSSP